MKETRLRNYNTEVYTYFTQPTGVTRELFTAEFWLRATLTLETAGPVAVGTRQEIAPVLSGKGIILTTDIPVPFVLSRGDRLYIAAESINRVKIVREPLPGGEIFDLLQREKGAV